MVFTLRDSLSNISFCDKQCSNLNNNVAKDKLIKHIENTHNMQIISRQFVPLNPHMLRNISFFAKELILLYKIVFCLVF